MVSLEHIPGITGYTLCRMQGIHSHIQYASSAHPVPGIEPSASEVSGVSATQSCCAAYLHTHHVQNGKAPNTNLQISDIFVESNAVRFLSVPRVSNESICRAP